MKPFRKAILFLFLSSLFGIFACQTPEAQSSEKSEPISSTPYDSTLAGQYGADDYGMHQYVMAFLKSGPNRSQDSLTRVNLQAAHMANIKRLFKAGKLIVAGPFLDNTELRGIYIFDVKTIEEAEELTSTDPAIQAGSLVMELHPWYGSAALMALPELYPKVTKVEF